MAMANAQVEGNRYIIVGVEDNENTARTVHEVDEKDFSGKPPYQAFLRFWYSVKAILTEYQNLRHADWFHS